MKPSTFFSTRQCFILLIVLAFLGACSVAEPRLAANPAVESAANPVAGSKAETAIKGATITIDQGGPADLVRVFYKHLRERRFREAIFLTNLRPAIEGLTDMELREFALDFEVLAGQVPAEIEINGEIITSDRATVTAKLPNADGENETQSIKLRRDDGVWVIMSADEEAAKQIKQDGRNYFFNLRIETHEEEARRMLERISKAQLAHSLQNGGLFTDMASLIAAGLLPDDIKTSDSTGYVYAINLATDKKKYTASATPARYGKSGRLSFVLTLDGKGISHVSSRDRGGKMLTK